MSRFLLPPLMALALVLCNDGTATASSYPEQQRVTAPVILELVSDADSFWAVRGVTNPACGASEPKVWIAPSLVDNGEDAWGRGEGASCQMWLSTSLVNTIIDPADAPGVALVNTTRACQAIAHETGHALGLPHTPTGLMAGPGPWGQPQKEPYLFAWAPDFCIRFARTWVSESLLDEGYSKRGARAAVSWFKRG